MTDAPAVFDPDVVRDVAADHDVAEATLREHLAALQTLAGHHDGIDGLVYEWRTAFHKDPLLMRTEEAYELVVQADVWRDFADRLDLDDQTLRAVMAVHDRQVRRNADERDQPVDLGEPLLLARE